jgi:hypothetical protein
MQYNVKQLQHKLKPLQHKIMLVLPDFSIKNNLAIIKKVLLHGFFKPDVREFYILKGIHSSYQKEVVSGGKLLRIFLSEQINSLNNVTSIEIRSNSLHVKKFETPSHSRINDILINRPELISAYFKQSNFNWEAFLELSREYNTTIPPVQSASIPKSKEDNSTLTLSQAERIKTKILEYEENGPVHMGERIFGYLLHSDLINIGFKGDTIKAWKEFTGIKRKPDKMYFNKPEYKKNITIIHQAQIAEIKTFFYYIDLKLKDL